MPPKYINHNGNIIKADQPLFNYQNRAFRYGDAIFETLRMMNGHVNFISDHLERHKRGLEILKMELPENVHLNNIEKQIHDLAAKNDIKENARIRLTSYRNDGGLYIPETTTISYIIDMEPLSTDRYKLNHNGLTVDIYSEIKKPINLLSNLKTTNNLIFVLAGLYKTENNIDDCLLLNEKGNIVEAISSNVFMVSNSQIYTPFLAEGPVNGIIRKQLIEITNIKEVEITEEELLGADEIFLTNSISGVSWVGKFKGKKYTKEIAEQMIVHLNELRLNVTEDG